MLLREGVHCLFPGRRVRFPFRLLLQGPRVGVRAWERAGKCSSRGNLLPCRLCFLSSGSFVRVISADTTPLSGASAAAAGRAPREAVSQ